MSVIKCNPAITSITFSVTGVVAITAGISAAITAAEGTGCVQGFQLGGQPKLVTTDAVTGNATIQMPSVITSITINGHVYAVNGSGQITAVVPADAQALLFNQPFTLVTG